RQWGVTRFELNEGQLCWATAMYFARRYCTPSALSLPPLAFGKTISFAPRAGSWSQDLRAFAACLVRGVQRSLRPLPTHRTWAPVPSTTSLRQRPVISESRKPV